LADSLFRYSLSAVAEKFGATDEVQKLIDIGKEKGYLLYDEVRDLLSAETSASVDDLDDLTPSALEKTNDPVRIYFRDMGTVPLLTRDGEIAIAKCIERGDLTVLKSLSRSPVIVHEIISLGNWLKENSSIIKDILQFRDEELTDDKIERKLQEYARFQETAAE